MSINFDTSDSREVEYYDVLTEVEMFEIHEQSVRSFDPVIHDEFDTREDYERMLLTMVAERRLTQFSSAL